MDALLALVRKDIVLYFSNRRSLLITLAAPILIAAFFGAVLGGPPKKPTRIPVAVTDLDGSEVSRGIVEKLAADGTFDLKAASESEGLALVREGKARAAIVIPKGFGESAPRAMLRLSSPKPEVAIHYDPSQAATLGLVRGVFLQHAMRGVGRAAFAPQGGGLFADTVPLPFDLKDTEVAGKADRGYNGYAHAFAGMAVQFVLFMGIELGVRLLLMRRMGLWKRLRAAPVSRRLLLGSRIVSGAAIAAMLLAGIYAAAIAFFGVRIEGSVVGFVVVAASFAVLTSTFGLLIAALGRTPEATRGLAILATLLLVMLGGAWVPTFVFPEWLQQATRFVPTRWAIDGLEAMTWRGLDVGAAWMGSVEMLALSVLFGAIAVRRFSWDE